MKLRPNNLAGRHTRVLKKSAAAVLFASALTLACSAESDSVPTAAGYHLLNANLPALVSSGKVAQAGLMDETKSLKLSLVLPLRNEAELDSLLSQLQDPQSPNYHLYLSSAEFTERFGANQQDYDKVVAWAKANGLTVTQTTPNRHVVDVQGPVATINRALHVKLSNYQHPTESRTFFAPDREPTLDLSVPLLGITGLTDVDLPKNHLVRGTTAQHMDAMRATHGSGPSGEYLPSDMRAAYYGAGPLTGAGQTVAIFSFDGYQSSDVSLYYSETGMTSSVPVNNVLVNGYSGACGSDTSTCDDGEQVLDIVNVIGMAPGLKQVLFYEGSDATDILNQMATDNIAKVISCSWYFPGSGSVYDTIYKQFAAQGQTFINATGDNGAYNASTWGPPSSDPNILQVGGTDLTTTGPGGAWSAETGWSGSGGGYYKQAGYATPAYQKLSGVITSTNKASSTYRNDPDVAAEANFDNPTVSNGAFETGFGGTSFAAPRWAGLLALANQQSVAAGKGTLGFVNTKIYTIATGSSYKSQFHDITSGNNKPDEGSGSGFNAVAGFDLVTGWGTAQGPALINALTQ